MVTNLAAAATSRAVLIGVSEYEDLPVILAARNSLQAMRDLLSDQGLCGWPPEQITIIPEPASARSLAIQIADLAEDTAGVFLLYYVGHGVLSARGELCLTVTSTRADRPKISSLPWADVAEVLRDCRARMRLVILDCCFAGQAIESLAAEGGPGVADIAHVAGVYTLTATTRNRPAHVPPPGWQDQACTSFTGELRDLIRAGIPGKPARLTLSDIYPVLRARLRAKGLPVPNQRGIDTAGSFPFTANAAASVDPLGQVRPGGPGAGSTAPTRPQTTHTDEPRARRILGDAIQCGHTITDEHRRFQALTYIAAVLAPIDPDRAERLARSLGESWHSPLGDVAEALAATDPDRAERLAQSITSESLREVALGKVAGVLAATDPDRAEHLAQSITSESPREVALGKVAGVLAATDPDRAERLAQSAAWAGSALEYVAEALAATDPDRAERLARSVADHSIVADAVLARVAWGVAATDPERAEHLAQSITNEISKAQALETVAWRLAPTDPERAERLARSITQEDQRDSTLWGVAQGLAATDPDRAEHVALSITSGFSAIALASIAEVVAAAEPDRAARLAAHAEHAARSNTDEDGQSMWLSIVAHLLALADPRRAERLAAEAERLAQSIPDEPSKEDALESVARMLAVTDPDRAERLAQSITSAHAKTLALTTIADIWIHGEDRQMAPSVSITYIDNT